MEGVVLGFATIAAVIAVGALIAHLGVVGLGAQQVLSRIAFFVASPALLLATVTEADVDDVLSRSLIATVVGVAVVVVVYWVVASWRWRRSRGERVIGALAGSSVNAGDLGLPVAAYVLGDPASWRRRCCSGCCSSSPSPWRCSTPTCGAGSPGQRPSARPFTNPLTIGTLLGLLLSITGWRLSTIVAEPVELIGAMAVQGMSSPTASRCGSVRGSAVASGPASSALTASSSSRSSRSLRRRPHSPWVWTATLLAVVVCSSLPTAQNIFVHATRYDRARTPRATRSS